MPVSDIWSSAIGSNENKRRRRMIPSMWKEYGMAKEWSEFWRKSNAPDYEGTAGGEHQTMIRRANELHGQLEPIDWCKFKATDLYHKEVFGTYLGERIAVSRLDYDAYVANKELPKASESGLYDYGYYGSYNEKKQLNEETDMKENKDHSTYHNHIDSLYKEKPMNADTHIDANDVISGNIRPAHYESSNPDVPPIQMWDYALSQNLGFFEGNIIKYVSRWRNKGGVQDLQKALTYLQRLIDSQSSNKP